MKVQKTFESVELKDDVVVLDYKELLSWKSVTESLTKLQNRSKGHNKHCKCHSNAIEKNYVNQLFFSCLEKELLIFFSLKHSKNFITIEKFRFKETNIL